MSKNAIGFVRRSAAALVVILVLGIVMVSAWRLLAQQDGTQPPPAPGDEDLASTVLDPTTLEAIKTMPRQQASAMLEPLREEARQAIDSGQYELAALWFLEVAKYLPPSPRTASALLDAGRAYAKAGKAAEAAQVYDQAAALCKVFLVEDHLDGPKRRETGVFKTDAAKDNLRRALLYKAELYRDSGDTEGAWQTVRRFRAEEPEYHYLRQILPLQAELQGVDLPALKAEETAAWELSDHAKSAVAAGDIAQAQALAQQAIDAFPETGGALIARNTLAAALWQEHRYAEAKGVYEAILDRVADVAPDSELGRTAAWHVAWVEVSDLGKRLIINGYNSGLPESEWQRAHDLCDVIRRYAPEHFQRAEMTMLRGELFYWRERYAEAVAMFDQAVGMFEGKIARKQGQDAVLLKNIVMMARQFDGFAHLKSGNLDEAIRHFTIVVDACKDDPNAVHGENAIAAGACLGLWQAYSARGDQDGMNSAESLMQERWPDSRPASYLRFYKTRPPAGP